jgi:S1-C subfamily serine protease
MTRLWKATGIAFGFLLTILLLAAALAAFLAALSGCATPGCSVRSAEPEGGVALAARSVVQVLVTVKVDGNEGHGLGSGVIVWRAGRVFSILTCHHVASRPGVTSMKVRTAGGAEAEAFLEDDDGENDLALLTVVGLDDDSPEIVIAPAPPERFARVTAIGSPSGYPGLAFDGRWAGYFAWKPEPEKASVRLGRVSGSFFFPGMSGGAVVDSRGRLVGIVRAAFPNLLAEGEALYQAGVAIPEETFRPFLQKAGATP